MPKEDVKEETHILWFALVNSASLENISTISSTLLCCKWCYSVGIDTESFNAPFRVRFSAYTSILFPLEEGQTFFDEG